MVLPPLGAAGVDCLGLASPLLDSGEVVHEAGLGVVELPVVDHLGLLEPQENLGTRREIRGFLHPEKRLAAFVTLSVTPLLVTSLSSSTLSPGDTWRT